jgi:hypothetical protein
MASDHMVWIGDFNRHHPMWEEDANSHLFKSENFISPLLNLLYRHNMLLALPKSIPTSRRAPVIGLNLIMFCVLTLKLT